MGGISFDGGFEKNRRMGDPTPLPCPPSFTMGHPANTHREVTDLLNHLMVKNTYVKKT